MKIKTLAIVVLSALSLSSTAALAETTPTTVNGGKVHFKGEIVNAACAVDAGSVDQTVQLGQVRTATLKQDGPFRLVPVVSSVNVMIKMTFSMLYK